VDIIISNDRSTLVYSYDHNIVCRRSSDLNIIWTKKVAPNMKAHELQTSANGQFVVAMLADTKFIKDQREYYTCVYDGKTGEELARLPTITDSGMAVSNDGKLLAISKRTLDIRKNEWILTVFVYEIPSKRMLFTVQHDRIKNDKLAEMHTSCIIRFTPNIQYMVTSGINTKIWKIER
jgi:hypothetical protein